MSRPLVIALGVVLWVAFIAVALLHAVAGDPAGPLVAVVVVASTVTMWHLGRRIARAWTRPDRARSG
jgi:hypothetical protein